MGVQSGIWQFDGEPVSQELVQEFSLMTAQHGPDNSHTHFVDQSMGVNYRAFHTTRTSRLPVQPYLSHSRNLIVWDGRLDNGEELCELLSQRRLSTSSDVEIVAAAFDAWGLESLPRLRGDWSLTLWEQTGKRLILAKDYAGVRHLYYWPSPKRIVWCSHLAPLVILSRQCFPVNEEYIAGYLGLYPAPDLTPYEGIYAVPPGGFVVACDGKTSVHDYWQPNRKMIRYKNDVDYEDHFRETFRQAVRRRVQSDRPVLAELSGGFDSSSIVCMADEIISSGEAETKRLDTISWFDDTEPSCDERPFFGAVEQKRGATGWHFNTANFQCLAYPDENIFVPVPGYLQRNIAACRAMASVIEEGGHRVVLSGVGGDELLGGVSDPVPLLADSIVSVRPKRLVQDLYAWSLVRKTPCLHLLAKAISLALFKGIHGEFDSIVKTPPWHNKEFMRKQRLAVRRMEMQVSSKCGAPSRRAYLCGLYGLKQQLALTEPSWTGCFTYAYPYLDQDLVEFLLAIPMQQIQRPGERRWLMRRALSSLLPNSVLYRKTKARGTRRWIVGMAAYWRQWGHIYESPVSSKLQYLDAAKFRNEMSVFINGEKLDYMMQFIRVVSLEHWLRDNLRRGLITADVQSGRSQPQKRHASSPVTSEKLNKIGILTR